MAGKLPIDRLQLEVAINGEPSRQELAKLEKQVKDLQKEMRNMDKTEKQALQDKKDELQGTINKYQSLKEAIKATGKTMSELGKDDPLVQNMNLAESKIKELKAEIKAMPQDAVTKMIGKKEELNAIKTKIDELHDSIGLTGLSLRELQKKQGELSALRNIIPTNWEEFKQVDQELGTVKRRLEEIAAASKTAKIDMAGMKLDVSGSLGKTDLGSMSTNQLEAYKSKLQMVKADMASTDPIFEKTKQEIQAVELELKKLNSVSLAQIHAEIEKSMGKMNIKNLSITGLEEYKAKLETVFKNTTPNQPLFGRVQDELKAVNTQMGVLSAGASGVKESSASLFGSLSSGFTKVLGVVMMVVTALMSLKNLFAGVIQLSDELVDIRQQTGLTEKQVDLLQEKFDYLNTRSARKELSAIATEAGSLGVAKNQVAEFTESMNMLSTVMKPQFGGNVGDLADRFGILRNVFTDIKTDNVGNDILHIGNAMDVLAKSGVATSPVVSDFANRIAGVGINLGLTTPQVLGISAALQELGVNPERGGTAVVKILQKMTTETDKFAQVAGLSVQDFTKMVNTDLFGAFQLVIQKSKEGGSSATVMANMIKELEVSGAGASEVFSKLGANTSLLTEKVRTASGAIKETSSITESYNLRNNNLAGNLEKVGKWLSSIFVNSTIMRGMEWFVNAWAEWIKKDPTEMLQKEQREVNILAETLKDSTVPMKERNRIYNELKDISPDIVKGIDIQNVSQKKLNENLAEYNKLMINKIYLAGQEKELTDLQRIAAEKKAAYMKAESAVMNEKVVYEERMERIRKGPSFTRMNNDDYYTDREADKKAVAEYDRWKKLLDDKKISMDSYLLHIKNISISASEAMGHGSKRSEKDIAEGRIDMVTLENNLGLSLNNGLHFGDKNSAEKLLDLKIKRQQSEEADRIAEERLNKLSKQKTDLGMGDVTTTTTGGDKGGGAGKGKASASLAGENNDNKYDDFFLRLQKNNLDERAKALKDIELEEKKNNDELEKIEKVIITKKGKKGGITDEERKASEAKVLIKEQAAKERLEVNQKYDLLEEEQAYKLKTAELMLQDATNKDLLKNQLSYETRKMLILKDSGINTIDQKTKIAEQEIKIQKLMEQIDAPTDLDNLDKKHAANVKAANAEIEDARERTKKLLEIDIDYYKEKMKLLEAFAIMKDSEGGDLITPEEQAKINEAMKFLIEAKKKLAALGKGGNTKTESFFGFKFEVNEKDFNTAEQYFSTMKSLAVNYFNSIQDLRINDIQKQIAATDELISTREEESKALETQISEAKTQKSKGDANSYDSLTKQKAIKDKEIADLKLQKKQEQEELKKAQAQKQKIQQAEQALNSVMQLSNMITAATEIYTAHSSIPWVGVAMATAMAAMMLVSFMSFKAQASAATAAYFDGIESVPLGNNPKGRDTIPARLHENERVVSAAVNEQLGDVKNVDLPKYVKAGKIALSRPLPLHQSLVQYHIHTNIDQSRQNQLLEQANRQRQQHIDALLNRTEHIAIGNKLVTVRYRNGQIVEKEFLTLD